jgi:hypothetical protein
MTALSICLPSRKADRGDGFHVKRIGHRQCRAFTIVPERNDFRGGEELRLKLGWKQRDLRQVRCAGKRQTEIIRQDPGKIRLGYQPQPREHHVEPFARLLLRAPPA